MSEKKEINDEDLKNVNGGGFLDVLKKAADSVVSDKTNAIYGSENSDE